MAHKASPPLLESTRVRPRGQCRAFACTPEQQMDTSTPAGKMVFTVLGAVAELERSLIVERVKAGLRNTRAKGQALGASANDSGHEEDCYASSARSRVEADRRWTGCWSGNYLSRRPGGFQNSGKGFLNPSYAWIRPHRGSPARQLADITSINVVFRSFGHRNPFLQYRPQPLFEVAEGRIPAARFSRNKR